MTKYEELEDHSHGHPSILHYSFVERADARASKWKGTDTVSTAAVEKIRRQKTREWREIVTCLTALESPLL